MRHTTQISTLLFSFTILAGTAWAETIFLKVDRDASPRVRHGVEKLADAFDAVGASAKQAGQPEDGKGMTVVVGTAGASTELKGLLGTVQPKADELGPEGFLLKSVRPGVVVVAGAGNSGTLYGCLELADRVREHGKLPDNLHVTDGPEFKLRGPCIGMQKLERDPYGGHYHWPYSPENFPFFYDKVHWTRYLDFLLEIRMNSLYLWNGHPFSSLVKLDEYPEAVEVSDEVLKKIREMMHWLTAECDKRGIWLIQMFYNIHLPGGLAKKHNLDTRMSRPTPVASNYTRKSIARFVERYPNVGLLVCLGEALAAGRDDWGVRGEGAQGPGARGRNAAADHQRVRGLRGRGRRGDRGRRRTRDEQPRGVRAGPQRHALHPGDDLRKQVAAATGKAASEPHADEEDIEPLPPEKFKLLTDGMETYEVKPDAKVFTDRDYAITSLAPELTGLAGIRFSHGDAKRHKDVVVEIEAEQPVKVLVGYFQDKRPGQSDLWLRVPDLEHVAHADERGGYDVQIRHP